MELSCPLFLPRLYLSLTPVVYNMTSPYHPCLLYRHGLQLVATGIAQGRVGSTFLHLHGSGGKARDFNLVCKQRKVYPVGYRRTSVLRCAISLRILGTFFRQFTPLATQKLTSPFYINK